MKISTTFRLLLATGGALAVAGGAVLITAQASGLHLGSVAANAATTSTPKSPPSTAGQTAKTDACNAYLKHLADHLKVSSANLDKAISAAAADSLKDQVNKGTITQAQADQIAKRLASGPACSKAPFLGAMAHSPKGGGQIGRTDQGYLTAAAAALNLSADTLRTNLKSGQTLAQMATAQKVSEDEFKARVRASLKTSLDAQVGAGKLSQAREDQMLNRLTAGDPPLWNGKPGH